MNEPSTAAHSYHRGTCVTCGTPIAEAAATPDALREAVISEAIDAVVARRARQSPAIGELDRLAVAVDDRLSRRAAEAARDAGWPVDTADLAP